MSAGYMCDDTLLASVWSTLNAQGLKAIVNFGQMQTAQDRDRRAWGQDRAPRGFVT